MEDVMTDNTTAGLREQIRDRYAAAATAVLQSSGSYGAESASCCPAPVETDDRFGSTLYDQLDQDDLPVAAVAASLGCGNPTAVAALRPGERVLDLGSGGGIDVLLSAKRVGPTGFAYGVDMTDEMLDLARTNAAHAGATNVEFVKGTIEDVPLPDETVDVVISNCVINLSVDKPKVIAEMFRVLVPGGRIGVSDVVAEDHVTPAERAERGSWVGCIAGGLSRGEYLRELAAVGFVDAQVRFTAQVADGMHNAIVQATKPGGPTPARAAAATASVTAAAAQVIDQGAEQSSTGTETAPTTCCDTGTASTCCAPSDKSGCCGDTGPADGSTGLPTSCGCR
jgi:arsenite methyltransferase